MMALARDSYLYVLFSRANIPERVLTEYAGEGEILDDKKYYPYSEYLRVRARDDIRSALVEYDRYKRFGLRDGAGYYNETSDYIYFIEEMDRKLTNYE